MTRARWSAGAVLAAMLVCGSAAETFAADLRNVLTDYTITSWTQRDGLPPGTIWALAQDADGFLWIGTDAGLYRFDGARFLSSDVLGYPGLPDGSVRVLHRSRDGSLWLGYAETGRIVRLRGRDVRHYDEHHGLPRATVTAFAEDRSGAMWAATEQGLFVLLAERWVHRARDVGLPDGGVYSAYTDPAGNLLVGAEHGTFKRPAGLERFDHLEWPLEQRPTSAIESTLTRYPRSFAEGPLGAVVVTDPSVGFRAVGARDLPAAAANRGRGYRLLLDRRGNLWVGTIGQGLWRVRRESQTATRTERATSLTGMPSDGIFALLEDDRGNIWAGTTEGLCRLTARRITQLTEYGIVAAIDEGPDGSIWVGTLDELLRFRPETPQTPDGRWPLGNTRLRAMYVDEHGTVWVSTDGGVARLPRGRDRLTPLPGAESLQQVDLITSDARAGAWLYDYKRGLFRWHNGQLTPADPGNRSRHAGIAMLYTDRTGRVWSAYVDGRISTWHAAGHQETYGRDDGLVAGVYSSLYEDDDGVIWLAATDGLTRFKNGRFVSVRAEHGFPANNLTAITGDDTGNLWIGTGTGIIRIAADDIDRAARQPADELRHSRYDRSDGLGGMPIAYNTNRRVVRANDGRLWFVTSRGLTLIDPRALGEVAKPAPLRIDYAVADDERVDAAANAELPARTSRLEIAYAELNLTAPLRTRFRYRLEGFDEDWVEAGSRRQVFYTNLPPRKYRFRVNAVGADGDLAEPGAIWDFSIQPMFYQTIWFYVAAAAVAGVGMWGAWRLRLRQVRRQFSLVLKERVRLSRELHDTLLQSLVGVALQFDAIATEVESSSPSVKAHFIRLRRQVEEFIREARQSILDLRSPKLEQRDLVTALKEAARHATVAHPVTLDFAVHGSPRPSSRKVEEQLLRIGQEAVTNALRHSRASQIVMELHYTDDDITLRVADNGVGFNRDDAPETNNHYGLISMQERAEEVEGRCTITSAPGRGTEVSATVPAASHQ